MRVEVDRDSCEANGVCESIVSEVFYVRDDDTLEIRQPEPPAELHDKVREAVFRCPKAALSLTD